MKFWKTDHGEKKRKIMNSLDFCPTRTAMIPTRPVETTKYGLLALAFVIVRRRFQKKGGIGA